MNGYVYISAQPVWPPEIPSPLSYMETITKNKVLYVFPFFVPFLESSSKLHIWSDKSDVILFFVLGLSFINSLIFILTSLDHQKELKCLQRYTLFYYFSCIRLVCFLLDCLSSTLLRLVSTSSPWTDHWKAWYATSTFSVAREVSYFSDQVYQPVRHFSFCFMSILCLRTCIFEDITVK